MDKRCGLLLVSVTILVLCLVGSASATNWSVDGSGGADFTRIQEAIIAASAGDTIIVKDGTYTENIDVDKRLTIRSENGPDSTIVLAEYPDEHVFKVTVDYVNISEFTVENATGWYFAGICLYDADYCNISNNICSNNGDGIRLFRSDNNNISNNICSSNYWSGIILGEHSLFGTNNNNISNNNCSYNHCGICLRSSDSNSITNNNCSYNNMDGIHFTDWSQDNSVTNNNCSYNKYNGISFTDWSQDNSVTNNNCSYNKYNGISFTHSNSNNLTGNSMVGNGISILGFERSHYYQKIDSSNTVNGKPVYYWKDIEGGRIPEGAGQVILVNCKNVVVENQKLNNASVGIEVAYCSNITIKNNNCSNNGDDGIYLRKSDNNHIYLNNFINNIDNVYSSESTNAWNSTGEITYTYNDSTYTNYLGNYWDDYEGTDADGNGIGDTPYSIDSDSDESDVYPLMKPFENYNLTTPAHA